MNLDKETIKKIRGLIVFTAIILIGLWNYEVVLDGLGFIGRVIFPFVLGGAIALYSMCQCISLRKSFSEIRK